MKEKYLEPEVEIISFEMPDVITCSCQPEDTLGNQQPGNWGS